MTTTIQTGIISLPILTHEFNFATLVRKNVLNQVSPIIIATAKVKPKPDSSTPWAVE